MDDKKFNEIMASYVASKHGNKEEDFKKLNFNDGRAKQEERKYPLKLVWASLSVILICAISLAISLPIVLNQPAEPDGAPPTTVTPTPEEPPKEPGYCDSDRNFKSLKSFDELKDYGFVPSWVPSMSVDGEQQGRLIWLYFNDTQQPISLFSEISLMYEYEGDRWFDYFRLNVFPKEYTETGIYFADVLVEGDVTVRDFQIEYYTVVDEKYNDYQTYLRWTLGDHQYFIRTYCYGKVTIEELIEVFFAE